MTDVSVRQLKNSLSESLRRAQEGEEIIAVSRKRPVARLSSLQGSSAKKKIQAAALRRLRALPGVSWAGGKPELPDKLVKLRDGKLASEPESGNYRNKLVLRRGETVRVGSNQTVLSVDDLLP